MQSVTKDTCGDVLYWTGRVQHLRVVSAARKLALGPVTRPVLEGRGLARLGSTERLRFGGPGMPRGERGTSRPQAAKV